MLAPQPAPEVEIVDNRSLLDLLAEYEALRRRMNADRASVLTILQRIEDQDDED